MRTVYYALDDDLCHIVQLKHSITSLRRFFAGSVEVHFFCGTKPDLALDNVMVVHHNSLGEGYAKYTCKWQALTHVLGEDILYLDTDTVVLHDPWALVENSKGNFLGRVDFGADESVADMLQIHYPLLRSLGSLFARTPTPVLNTGVMFFLGGIHKTLAELSEDIWELIGLFKGRKMPYPSNNWMIVEEVAAALAIAKYPILFEEIPQQKLPSYYECIHGLLEDKEAYILHIWHKLYPKYLEDTGQHKALQEYLSSPFGFNQK